MFEHRKWIERFLAQPGYNDSICAKIESVPNAEFKCIGVHHLSGEENGGKHNVYIDVVDQLGKRVHAKVAWTWVGRRPDELAPPLYSTDKPESEPGCNVSIMPQQNVSVWVDGSSDVVSGIITSLPDESPGNTWGHHSHYVVFARRAPTPADPNPQPAPEPAPEPWPDTPVDLAVIYSAAAELSQLLVNAGEVLWTRILQPLERYGIQGTHHDDTGGGS